MPTMFVHTEHVLQFSRSTPFSCLLSFKIVLRFRTRKFGSTPVVVSTVAAGLLVREIIVVQDVGWNTIVTNNLWNGIGSFRK